MNDGANGRRVVIARDGVALVEPEFADQPVLDSGDDLFAVDPDPRPMPVDVLATRLTVVDTDNGSAVLGNVSWIPVVHGPTVASVAWNIGIRLLPTARGRGVGSLAQRLLVEHLFATTDMNRIEAATDVDNIAEQRALTKAGLRREGALRGAQLRGGVWRDVALFSVLRSEL